MRCFIAVFPPKGIQDYLTELQEQLYDVPGKIRWVKKEQIHLTLKFLGDVDGNVLKKVKERLGEIKERKFSAHLGKIGVFPDWNYIRVLWINLQPIKKIISLQQDVEKNLLEFFSKDTRFASHITLGRVKFVNDKEKFRKIVKRRLEDRRFVVDSFSLMKSELGKEGTRYEIIRDYKLKGYTFK